MNDGVFSRESYIHAFDIDSSSNILACGKYSDNKIFMGYFELGFREQWVKEISGSSGISFCHTAKFQHIPDSTSPKVMGIFSNSDP